MIMNYAVIMIFAMLLSKVASFSSPSRRINNVVVARFVTSTTPTQLSAITSLSFDPSEDIRDKATSTLVIGRHSTLKSLIDKTDAYVSLFGFRPHPDILNAMHETLHGNAASTSHIVVPTVGPAAPRPPHRMSLISVKNKVTRNNHPLSLHAMSGECAVSYTIHK